MVRTYGVCGRYGIQALWQHIGKDEYMNRIRDYRDEECPEKQRETGKMAIRRGLSEKAGMLHRFSSLERRSTRRGRWLIHAA